MPEVYKISMVRIT